MYCIGEQLCTSIQDLVGDLESEDPFDATIFTRSVQDLTIAVDNCKSLSHWSRLIRIQYREMSRYIDEVDTPKYIQKQVETTPKPSTSFNTPNNSSSRNEVSRTVKKFSPLIKTYSQIQCTSITCTSTFTHKRTYLKHMKKYHPYINPDQSIRDPKGTCELISPKTGLPCGSKFSFRAMYVHLETVHSVKKPSKDHILVGFDLTSTPTAIFALKGDSTDFLDSTNSKVKHVDESESNPDLEIVENKSQQEVNLKRSQQDSDGAEVSHPKKLKRIDSESSDSSNSKTSRKAEDEMKTDEDIDSLITCNTQPILSENDDNQNKTYYSDIDEYQQAETQASRQNDGSPRIQSSSSSLISKDDEIGAVKISIRKGAKRKCFSSCSSTSTLSPPKKEQRSNANSDSCHDTYEQKVSNMDDDDSFLSEVEEKEKEKAEDSDYVSGDGEEFTNTRRENKAKRYASRMPATVPIHEHENNIKFIEDFTSFMRLNSPASSKKEDNPTIAKYIRHLFTLPDSLLSHETKQNKDFSLENLRMFDSATYVHLKYPLDWLSSTNIDANRGTDCLKAHSALRHFLQYEVDRFSQSKDFSDIKKAVRDNLEAVNKQISSSKLFRKFSIQTNIKKHKKDTAKLILEPSKQLKIENLIKTWHNSFECDELEKDMNFIYENAIKSKHISNKNLTKYCNFARVYLLLRLD